MKALISLMLIFCYNLSFAEIRIGILEPIGLKTLKNGKEVKNFDHFNKVKSIIEKYRYHNSKIIYKGFTTLEEYYQALNYMIDQKIDVINLSYGVEEYDPQEFYLLKKMHDQGTLIVVASGNDNSNLGKNPVYPCSFSLENLICVGAGSNSKKNQMSNYGKGVDLFVSGKWNQDNATSFSAPKVTATLSWIVGRSEIQNYREILESRSQFVVVNGYSHRFTDFDKIIEDLTFKVAFNGPK